MVYMIEKSRLKNGNDKIKLICSIKPLKLETINAGNSIDGRSEKNIHYKLVFGVFGKINTEIIYFFLILWDICELLPFIEEFPE